jgi:hypothetical protein
VFIGLDEARPLWLYEIHIINLYRTLCFLSVFRVRN